MFVEGVETARLFFWHWEILNKYERKETHLTCENTLNTIKYIVFNK